MVVYVFNPGLHRETWSQTQYKQINIKMDIRRKLGMVAHAYNIGTWQVEAGGSEVEATRCVQGQSGLQETRSQKYIHTLKTGA